MQRAISPSDRRAFGRRESLIHAIARLPGRGAEPCIVRNYSDSGALLSFPGDIDPPQRFRLTVDAKGLDVMCEVRRRNGAEIGVFFLSESDTSVWQAANPLETPEPTANGAAAAEPAAPPVQKLLRPDGPVTVVSGEALRRKLMG